MTMARSHLVDVSITRWYHCITRCVRRAFLLGEGPLNRKEWIENRLEELAEIFAVAVGGFSDRETQSSPGSRNVCVRFPSIHGPNGARG